MSEAHPSFVVPRWPAPQNVRAVCTTRNGGVSAVPYASFNLAEHVGDDAAAVRANRARLRAELGLANEPVWLRQVHGSDVIDAASVSLEVTADGAYTKAAGLACAVLTADCLPIFLCDRKGEEVALLHGGWRGLAAGIIEAGVARFTALPDDLIAWLGPAIGARAYEVGEDVRDAFLAREPLAAQAFRSGAAGKWYMDLYGIARQRLRACGVPSIHGGDYCTATRGDLFYSYRRDGVTGRMASLIWRE